MNIAILGRTRILYHTIDSLIQRGHNIVLIGTCKASDEYDIREEDFEIKAKGLDVPFFNDSKINSNRIIGILKKTYADIAVSFNWRTIIQEDTINCFKYGIINGHCGDLPRYRGNACPNWSIVKGDDSYTISIHYMEPGELDSGDILLKKTFSITDKTTITDIYANMNETIPDLFCEAINIIDKNGKVGTPQSKDPNDSLRCYPRMPADSFIDWNLPCEDISRIVRASCSPFAGAYTYYENKKLYIMKVETRKYDAPCYVYPGQIIGVFDGAVDIAASDGIIRVKEFIIDGDVYRSSDIIKSIRIRLNYRVEDEIFQLKQEIVNLKNKLIMCERNAEEVV